MRRMRLDRVLSGFLILGGVFLASSISPFRCPFPPTSSPLPKPEKRGERVEERAATLDCRIAFHIQRGEKEFRISTIRIDGTDIKDLTSGHWDSNPWFSPDGKQIVFDRDEEIYIANADGSEPRNLTHNPKANSCPTIAGDKVAFQTNRDGNFAIYVVNTDGTGLQRLTQEPSNNACPAFSSDGKRIAFVSDRDGPMEIYVINVNGTGLKRLTANAGNNMDPAFSPDGRKIVFISDRDGNFEIYLMDSDGSNPTRLTYNDTADVQPAFSPDGRQIAYERGGNIYVMDLEKKEERPLTQGTVYKGGPSWGPNCVFK